MRSTLALALLPELLAARAVGNVRRSVECGFGVAANPGDTCDSFATNWGISVDQLKTLNPGLDCDNFGSQDTYCIVGTVTPDAPGESSTTTSTTSSSSTSTTTTSTTTTSTTSKATSSAAQPAPTSNTPSPTQPGIADNCDKYHKVVSGDGCGAIEAQYGISNDQFSQWNPNIDSQCSNLWVDYYVCVGV
ncbi:hypothetical protein ESCO_001355 [Escovopsis weberi]|uniref:LysM domain-containing protein n=1 Tax=Escovopsis weberi TaxID=150374 RepID=A0A0M8N4K4_ESCWE|nr:hypothetical protein ESCO_001355 [Escovopsis weberi]